MSYRIRGRRGSSLIEVLVAMAILGLVVAGVLQTFSLALLQSQGSSARTHLTYKCQQVVEILRISQYLARNGNTAFTTSYGIANPLSSAVGKGYYPLPYDKTDTVSNVGPWIAWGPSGANIVEQADEAYRIYYVVENSNVVAGANQLQVRVTAVPVTSLDLPNTLKPATAAKLSYSGRPLLKKVEYVAQITPAS